MAETPHQDESEAFPHITRTPTISNGAPCVAGTRLKVWQLLKTYRFFQEDVVATADHYTLTVSMVEEAVEYARVHSDEIERAIREDEEWAELARRGELPGVEVYQLPAD